MTDFPSKPFDPKDPRLSTRERVYRISTLEPHLSGAEIGRRAGGISRERVRKILGPGKLTKTPARDSIHLNLSVELRRRVEQAVERAVSNGTHANMSEWCRDVLTTACELSEASEASEAESSSANRSIVEKENET